jgi:hypothetical protein
MGVALRYLGWYDVAASSFHTALGRWLFATALDHSVAAPAGHAALKVKEKLESRATVN